MNLDQTTTYAPKSSLTSRRPRELFYRGRRTAPIAGDRMCINRGHLFFTRGGEIIEIDNGKKRMDSYQLAEAPSSIISATDYANIVALAFTLTVKHTENEDGLFAADIFTFEFS